MDLTPVELPPKEEQSGCVRIFTAGKLHEVENFADMVK
jgi:hypothetical protein